MTKQETSEFQLSNIDVGFSSRTKDVFAGLSALEEQHSAFVKRTHDLGDTEGLLKPDPVDEYQIAEAKVASSFKNPIGLPPKAIPRSKKCSKNWTMYNLSDVTPDELSEKANQMAALDLMRKVRDVGSEEDCEVDSEWTSGKHIFKKPEKSTVKAADEREKGASSDKSASKKRVRSDDEDCYDDYGHVVKCQDSAADNDGEEIQETSRKMKLQNDFRGKGGRHFRGRSSRDDDEDDDEDFNGSCSETKSTNSQNLLKSDNNESDNDSDEFPELKNMNDHSDDDDDKEMSSPSMEIGNPLDDADEEDDEGDDGDDDDNIMAGSVNIIIEKISNESAAKVLTPETFDSKRDEYDLDGID